MILGNKTRAVHNLVVLGFFGLLMLLAGGCTGTRVVRSTSEFPTGTGFSRHDFVFRGQTETVWVFLPRNYDAKKKYPAILFLHGLFEAGSGGNKCLSGGLAPVIASYPEHWPFITIFPQSDSTWESEDRQRMAIGALNYAQAHWSIDQDRIVLAGLSYGGLGTWDVGARYPERFAALVPMSGFGSAPAVKRISSLPIWAFVYTGDPWVRSTDSVAMCEQIRDAGGTAILTEFTGVGHDCVGRAVNDSDLVTWMLRQRRSPLAAQKARNLELAGVTD
jgi:predicted peptidase